MLRTSGAPMVNVGFIGRNDATRKKDKNLHPKISREGQIYVIPYGTMNEPTYTCDQEYEACSVICVLDGVSYER